MIYLQFVLKCLPDLCLRKVHMADNSEINMQINKFLIIMCIILLSVTISILTYLILLSVLNKQDNFRFH